MNKYSSKFSFRQSCLVTTYLLLTTSGQNTQQDTITDLFIFLLRYSFMQNDATKSQNSCASKTTQLNATQGNIYMGARYLGPKYSRWTSVDPALGEYMCGSDAGCGGIYNHVNLSLYHYAANNPVKYVDPTGAFIWDENGQGGFVTEGDTLSQIVAEYNRNNGTNLNYSDIAEKNGILNPDKISINQRIGFNDDITLRPACSDIILTEKEKLLSPKLSRPQLDTTKNIAYNRGANIAIGILEILGGGVIAAGTIIGAGAVEIGSGGAASIPAGWAVLGGWSTGSTFVAFGITRLTGTNNSRISDDINSIFNPAAVNIAEEMDKASKREHK